MQTILSTVPKEFAIFHSFIHSFNVCLLCFHQIPSTALGNSFPALSWLWYLYIYPRNYRSFCCLLPFQIRTSCEYLDVFLTVLKFSKLLVHLVPSERSTQKLEISRACPGCHVHMRKESGLRHRDTKIVSLIKKGRPAETLKSISVCCFIDSYAI